MSGQLKAYKEQMEIDYPIFCRLEKLGVEEFKESNSKEKHNDVINLSKTIENSGIKHKDACHIACAILANCDYFITTDYRLLKYKTDLIKIINPTNFVKELEFF